MKIENPEVKPVIGYLTELIGINTQYNVAESRAAKVLILMDEIDH